MGSALQRLEILLIGLVLVITGAVVAILMIVHPSTPTAVVPASPTPIAIIPAVALTQTTSAAATTVPVQTPALIDNAAPLSSLAPTSVPQSGSTGELSGRTLIANFWPMLLLAVGLIGLLLATRRFGRRRMSYTNQNVSQLLAAADAETRATNLRVMRTLAQQGVLPAALATAAGIDLDVCEAVTPTTDTTATAAGRSATCDLPGTGISHAAPACLAASSRTASDDDR